MSYTHTTMLDCSLFHVHVVLWHASPAAMIGIKPWWRNECWVVPVLTGGEDRLCYGLDPKSPSSMFVSPVVATPGELALTLCCVIFASGIQRNLVDISVVQSKEWWTHLVFLRA